MKLKAGDIRQEGDEVRHTCIPLTPGWNEVSAPTKCGPWKPITLVGWPILKSDLMAAEFRRTPHDRD